MNNSEYKTFISSKRKAREDIINNLRAENDQPAENFEYFPVDEKWKIKADEVKTRKPKDGVADFNFSFQRVGIVRLTISNSPEKFDLLQLENTEDNYIFLKDGTSGKTTYGLGRFVPVLKENEEYIIDFNLAYTPACGHIEGSACPWARENTAINIEAGEKASKD